METALDSSVGKYTDVVCRRQSVFNLAFCFVVFLLSIRAAEFKAHGTQIPIVGQRSR